MRLGLESESSWPVRKISLKVQLEQFVFRDLNLKSYLSLAPTCSHIRAFCADLLVVEQLVFGAQKHFEFGVDMPTQGIHIVFIFQHTIMGIAIDAFGY